MFENANATRSLYFDFNNVTYDDATTSETYQGSYSIIPNGAIEIEIKIDGLGTSKTSLSMDSEGSFITFLSERHNSTRDFN